MNWEPTTGEVYWYINGMGRVVGDRYDNGCYQDNDRYEFGNCFKTKELAEGAAKKIKRILNALEHD